MSERDLDYIANHDQDPKVRIAAVKGMGNWRDLDYIANHDQDASVRAAAVSRMVELKNEGPNKNNRKTT